MSDDPDYNWSRLTDFEKLAVRRLTKIEARVIQLRNWLVFVAVLLVLNLFL